MFLSFRHLALTCNYHPKKFLEIWMGHLSKKEKLVCRYRDIFKSNHLRFFPVMFINKSFFLETRRKLPHLPFAGGLPAIKL